MIPAFPSSAAKVNPHSIRGFTVAELLVVVAVIGVLLALAVPALGRGRQTSHSAVCSSNQRQLGIAAQLYWDDHAGRTFAYRSHATNGGDVYWFGWIERGAEGTRRFDIRQGALHPYLGGNGPELCPSLNHSLEDFKLKACGAAYGYGYNLHLSPSPGQPSRSITDAKTPAGLLVFADSAQINDFQAPASPSRPMLEEFYYLSSLEPTAHFRHGGLLNALHADGHVGREKMQEGTWDQRLPKHMVGRVCDWILVWK